MFGVTASGPRAVLATLPTPLEVGPTLPGGARLLVKRDDLSGLGGGGNKARKLGQFLCGATLDAHAQALVTVGAAQSNHCRMTTAAGARLGLEVHLVLSGDEPAHGEATGNQLLSVLFGAQLHYTGARTITGANSRSPTSRSPDHTRRDSLPPLLDPDRGEHRHGCARVCHALTELLDQLDAAGLAPSTIVFTSSSGGTHAGLLAGRAAALAAGRTCPAILAVGVAKGVNVGYPDVAALAAETLELMDVDAVVEESDVEIDTPVDRRRLHGAEPRQATRRSTGLRHRAAGSSTGPTPARGSPACWGRQRRGGSPRVPTSCSCTPAGGRRCSSRWRTASVVVPMTDTVATVRMLPGPAVIPLVRTSSTSTSSGSSRAAASIGARWSTGSGGAWPRGSCTRPTTCPRR